MSALIAGAEQLRRKLTGLALKVLPDLQAPLRATANTIRAKANVAAPREDGELVASSFVDGPSTNRLHHSMTMTAGYEAPHAPYVHAGVHFGRQLEPNHFLEEAADGQESRLAELVGEQIMRSLAALKE